ncbi:MAG: hypothetical protein EBY39_14520 [Flavobacteriia bacterium]|nr:hypothetical protein [Flavobacteriia bacterium]
MPLYTYEHPETKEILDVVQGMNDEHIYIDKQGIKWKRVWNVPQASIDSSSDPFDGQAFKNKTANQKGSYGDLIDQSKELSQKRKDKLGYDPVQKKYFKEYSKKRRGIKHPLDKS